jgi:CTP:molybdopterin cytidylyltransferase MocA
VAEQAGAIAIILAAGAGSRMGAPKALMPVNGEPWWETQSRRLRTIGVPTIWVVSQAVNAAMPAGDPVRRIIADEKAPMLASVLVGARALLGDPPSGVFILPIDTPAPDQKTWNDLAATGAVASPMFQEHRGHPVYLPWGWVRRRLLDPALDPASARLDHLIGADIVRVPTDDPDSATNLNRPADLEQWLHRNRSTQ